MAQDELFWFVFVSYSILSACVFGMIWISNWKMDQRQKQWSAIINPQIPEEGEKMGNNNNNFDILRNVGYRTTDIIVNGLEIGWNAIVFAYTTVIDMVVGAYSYVRSKIVDAGSVIQSKWEGFKSFCELKKIAFDSYMEERSEAKVKVKAEKAQVKVEEVKAEVLAEPKQSLRSRIFGPSKLDIVIELLKETNGKLDTLTEVVRDLDPTLVPEPKMMHQDVLDADPKVTEPFENEPVIELPPSIMMENANKVMEETRMTEADTEVVDPVDDEVGATVVEVEEIEKEKEEIRLQIDAHYEAVAEKYHEYNLKQQSVDSDCGREGNALNLPNGVATLKEMIGNDPHLTAVVQELNPEWESIKNWSKLRGLVAKAVKTSMEKATA